MQRIPKSSRMLTACLCAALVLLCVLTTVGQSGRRARKPAPLPTPSAEPSPTPLSAEKAKPLMTFIVGMNKLNDYSTVPMQTRSAVLRACANRLDEPEPVKADTTSKDMNRGEAVLRAKSEKEAYIVWLRLRPNDVSGRAGSGDSDDLYIEYSVFAPATGKETASGRVFPSYRTRTIIPGPSTSSIYSDGYLIQAAKETAERILADFHIRSWAKVSDQLQNSSSRQSDFRYSSIDSAGIAHNRIAP